MRQITGRARSATRIERTAVRIVLIDVAGDVLLLSTRDASNPGFGSSWELPGGGVVAQESIAEAIVRELREETGIQIPHDAVSSPLWHRDVLYTYRGERRRQHEIICVARIFERAPRVDDSGREMVEREDHLLHRWWQREALLTSTDRFYPRSLPKHLDALLAGREVEEPLESWDE